MKSPEVSLCHDKGALLPTSTKASSDDDRDSSGDGSGNVTSGSLQLSSRHLPPVYVDIQEEIEHNLDEINKLSKCGGPLRIGLTLGRAPSSFPSRTRSRLTNLLMTVRSVGNLRSLHTQRIKSSFFSDSGTIQVKTVELSH